MRIRFSIAGRFGFIHIHVGAVSVGCPPGDATFVGGDYVVS